VQIKRREQEFLFITVKREKRKKKAKQRRREREEKKAGRSKEKSPKPAWPLFFFARTSSQRPGVATAVPSPPPVSAPGKSTHSLCFAF